MRKILGYEYPYFAPEDFTCEALYTSADMKALKTLIQDCGEVNALSDNLFRKIIIKAAQNYCCEEYYRGADSLSGKQIEARIEEIHHSASKLKERLFSVNMGAKQLPIELFEEFIERLSPREDTEGDYDLQDTSHYAQCRINDSMGLPTPSANIFYQNHAGYAELSGILARLSGDLNRLAAITHPRNALDQSWERERLKKMGVQRGALQNYVTNLALLWEYCTDEPARITINDDGAVQSNCLDFIEVAFKPVESYYRLKVAAEIAPRERTQLHTSLHNYRNQKTGKRSKYMEDSLLEELCENLSLQTELEAEES